MILERHDEDEGQHENYISDWIDEDHDALSFLFLLLDLLRLYAESELKEEGHLEILRREDPMLSQEKHLAKGKRKPDPVRHAVIIELSVVAKRLLPVSHLKSNVTHDQQGELNEDGWIVITLPAYDKEGCQEDPDKYDAVHDGAYPILHISHER